MLREAVCFILCVVATAATAQSGVPTAPTPSPAVQVMLVKNTLTALNHAAITGNFTVLRDLGSEGLKARRQPADLAVSFQEIRLRSIDLSPVLVRDPQLSEATLYGDEGKLRLVGTVPTTPIAVRFDLWFQYGANGWGIDDLAVALCEAAPTESLPTRVDSDSSEYSRVDPVVVQASATIATSPLRRLPMPIGQ